MPCYAAGICSVMTPSYTPMCFCHLPYYAAVKYSAMLLIWSVFASDICPIILLSNILLCCWYGLFMLLTYAQLCCSQMFSYAADIWSVMLLTYALLCCCQIFRSAADIWYVYASDICPIILLSNILLCCWYIICYASDICPIMLQSNILLCCWYMICYASDICPIILQSNILLCCLYMIGYASDICSVMLLTYALLSCCHMLYYSSVICPIMLMSYGLFCCWYMLCKTAFQWKTLLSMRRECSHWWHHKYVTSRGVVCVPVRVIFAWVWITNT